MIFPIRALDHSSSEEIMDEIARLVPIYGGIGYSRLEETGIKWPCPDAGHPGTDVYARARA